MPIPKATYGILLTAAQFRMARAALDLRREDVAHCTGLSVAEIESAERAPRRATRKDFETLDTLQLFYERSGVKFRSEQARYGPMVAAPVSQKG